MSHANEATTSSAAAAPRRVNRHMACSGPAVAIIGAGFSGTMAAIHLRHVLPPSHSVLLFDRTGRFARGPAYSATEPAHLLNVRAANMSALPDDPSHFERWLERQVPHETGLAGPGVAGTFASRRLYGRYLRALLYEEMRRSGGRVRLCADRAIGLERHGAGWCVHFASGRALKVAAVVLALGNLPPAQPCDGVVFPDPWVPAAATGLRPGEPVLIVGTGLTMVDLALAMHAHGFEGPIVALSRRGLVPQPHAAPQPPVPCEPFSDEERRSLPRLLTAVRRRISEAAAAGADWRAVLDGLRPYTTALWQGLPVEEQRRLLRHLRPYWDSHRHRMASATAEAFSRLVERGSVVVKRGRVRSMSEGPNFTGATAAVAIQERGRSTAETMVFQRVLYATGPGAHAVQDSLVAGLVAAGSARTDAHGLGLDVTAALQLLDRNGEQTHAVWALGPLVRGIFWECTAVPDIRLQACRVAAEIAHALNVG
jgi:uncharacterized NAD(P)/FAD-binding protein YdhS